MKYLTTFLSLSLLALTAVAKPDPRQFKPSKPESGEFPRHWGSPPEIQTRDMVKLPGKFGMGSSTLAKWISENLKRDISKDKPEPQKPKPPLRPKPPKEIKQKIDSYQKTQKELQSELQKKLKNLGEKPSRELVRKTVESYRKDNSSIIEAQKELGKKIQAWQKENRPERPKRPEPPQEVKVKIAEVKQAKSSIDIARKGLIEDLKGKSKEDKETLIKAFKESQKEKHKQLKDAQKALAEEVRNRIQTKDRRE